MAKQNNLSLLSFQKIYSTDTICRERLFKMRWPNGFICPKCGNKHYYFLEGRNLYQCSNCKYQASVTAGTIFHKSRTSLKKWFWAIYLVSKDKGGISALALKKHINVCYQTAWLMLHKIRNAMNLRDMDYDLLTLVEVKKRVIIGKRKKDLVIEVAISSKTDRPKFAKVRLIEGEGDKLADKGYKKLSEYEKNKRKEVMRWLNLLISNMRSVLNGTYHCGCREHLQLYLDEYCYRFNRRFWEKELFNRLLFASVKFKAITYAELTG
ncbi:MAG: transposase [Brevinematales bacterium]|nr:transposase [Brevinematales bacterium]